MMTWCPSSCQPQGSSAEGSPNTVIQYSHSLYSSKFSSLSSPSDPSSSIRTRGTMKSERPLVPASAPSMAASPSATTLASADLLDHMKHASEFGISAGDVAADPEAIAKRRDQIVSRLVKGVTSLTKKNKVEYIVGRGKLEGPQQVRVQTKDAEGKSTGEVILKARDVVLATGSRVKSLPGLVPEHPPISRMHP